MHKLVQFLQIEMNQGQRLKKELWMQMERIMLFDLY